MFVSTDFDFAWAAGFFDGEGHAGTYFNNTCWQLTLQISQKDKRPLERFSRVVGHGKVNGPYTSQGAHYKWASSGKQAYRIISLLWPYLSAPKREQIDKALVKLIEARKIV